MVLLNVGVFWDVMHIFGFEISDTLKDCSALILRVQQSNET